MMLKRPRETRKPIGSEKPNKFVQADTSFASLFYMYYMTYIIFFVLFTEDNVFVVVNGYSLKHSSNTGRGVDMNQYFHTEKLLPPLTPIQRQQPQQHDDEKIHHNRNNPNIEYMDQYNLFTSDSYSPYFGDVGSSNRRKDSSSSSSSSVDHPMMRLGGTSNTNSLTKKNLPVIYTNDPSIVAKWLSDCVPSTGCTLGFDVESVVRRKWYDVRPPSVVQIATVDQALVIHLVDNHGGESRDCVPILEALLTDETIIKAGVAIDQDMLNLMEWDSKLIGKSRLDLSILRTDYIEDGDDEENNETNRLRHHNKSPGLKKLAADILGLSLPKSNSMATGMWNQVPLSSSQISYGARDAWVAAAIVNVLEHHDYNTFSTHSLLPKLKNQECSMEELYQRHLERKNAKLSLTKLMLVPPNHHVDVQQVISTGEISTTTAAPTTKKRKNTPEAQKQPSSTRKLSRQLKKYQLMNHPLPEWKASIVKELEQVLTMNIHVTKKSDIYYYNVQQQQKEQKQQQQKEQQPNWKNILSSNSRGSSIIRLIPERKLLVTTTSNLLHQNYTR